MGIRGGRFFERDSLQEEGTALDEDKEEEAWGESQQKCQEWHWFSTLDMKPEAGCPVGKAKRAIGPSNIP